MASHKADIVFIELILWAKKAFDINFESSELHKSVVKTLTLSIHLEYMFTKSFMASLSSPPIKTLSGFFKSLIAVPSAKNSGFERTENVLVVED